LDIDPIGGTDSNLEDIDFSNPDSDFGNLSQLYGNLFSYSSCGDESGPLSMLTNAIEPTETVADHMQSLSTKTVELTSCGVQFAVSAAMNKSYSKSVELSMTAGLEVLRSVSALLNMETHVSDCQGKMKDSRTLVGTDEEVCSVPYWLPIIF